MAPLADHRFRTFRMTDSQAISAKAVALHKAGRLDEAISLYREAMSGRPQDADLSFMLGMALLQKGVVPRAVELIRAAATARPEMRPRIRPRTDRPTWAETT